MTIRYALHTNFYQILYCKRNTKDIQFLMDNHPTILLFHIYYINKLFQKYNENMFTNTLSPMFILRAMDINH